MPHAPLEMHRPTLLYTAAASERTSPGWTFGLKGVRKIKAVPRCCFNWRKFGAGPVQGTAIPPDKGHTARQLLLSHCKLRTTAADKFPTDPRRLAEDPTFGVAFKIGAHMFQKLRGLQKEHKKRSASGSRRFEKQSMPNIPATLCAPTHCNRMITCPSCPIP